MKIVFATFGSLGDVHPFLALALEIQCRGHDVRFATSEIYRAKIEATGLEFAPLRPDIQLHDKRRIAALMHPRRGTKLLLKNVLFPAIRHSYDDLKTATQNADLLVTSDIIYAAPILTSQTKLRWVSVTLAPMVFFSVSDPSVFSPAPTLSKLHRFGPRANSFINKIARFHTRSWSRPAYDLRRELGLPRGRDPIFDEKYSPHRVLALFSKTLGAPQPDWPPQTRQTGFCFYDTHKTDDRNATESTRQIEEFLRDGAPPIVFTLGSAAVWSAGDFYHESARAAKKLNRRALFLMGANAMKPLPDSMLAVDYAPYSLVFARAAAVVHQGGVGTTAQAMRAGVPQIVVPFSHDQPDNAARVVRSGAGLSIARSRYSAKNIERALKHLLETPSFSQRAQEIAGVIAQENGLQSACDELEREPERAV